MMAAARYGLEHELTLEPALPATPTTTRRRPGADHAARRAGAVAVQRGGPDGLRRRGRRPLRQRAPVELAAFDAAVTDWELFRGFERL
jgi:glutamine synthetase